MIFVASDEICCAISALLKFCGMPLAFLRKKGYNKNDCIKNMFRKRQEKRKVLVYEKRNEMFDGIDAGGSRWADGLWQQ